MGRRGWREQAVLCGHTIQDTLADDRITRHLTEEERDWMKILEERLYSIYNKRLPPRQVFFGPIPAIGKGEERRDV